MERLPNSVLENAIRVFVIGEKSALDKCVLSFLKELQELRDAEENGLLVRLPCKVGDCLYSIALGRVTKHKIYGCRYNGNDVFLLWVPGEFRVDGIPAKSIGKTAFLTQAEAEAKLKEMEGKDD